MMTRPPFLPLLACALVGLGAARAGAQSTSSTSAPALSQAATAPSQPPAAASPLTKTPVVPVIPRWARISFFGSGASTSYDDGGSSTFSELTTSLSARSAQRADGGFEYALDTRFGAFPSSEERDQRISIYDAYVGQRVFGGHVLVRAGQMWLNDLGALGSIGGGLLEFGQLNTGKRLRFRVGAFGGLEPRILEPGYTSNVTKFGGYVALDGNGAQKHVIGYVNVRNKSLTERSVLSVTNYIPVGQKFFLYQAAEVDLSGPGGEGDGGLSYFFANARISPVRRADLQVTYHRGRSIDARTITDDILNGRPVTSKQLEGYLYESANARLSVEVVKNVRVFAGYGQDKNDSSAAATGRLSVGVYSSNLFKSGIDVNVTDYRYDQPGGSSYDSWYASVGRSFGSKVYLTADYSSSLSIIRYTQSSGIVIESKPSTKRFGGSAMINLTRVMSLMVTGEHTQGDDYKEARVMSGITYRF